MRLDSFLYLSAVLGLACFLAGAQGAMAQERPALSQPPPSVPKQAEPHQSLPREVVLDSNEITVLKDNYAGKYNNSTIENLSNLYWRLGAFDLEDDMAIANYIKINNCKVYTDYINDDMEWRKIVETMRGHLAKAKDTFPVNYQFVVQLHLGRYDPHKGGFPIIDRTGFQDSKRIELNSIDMGKDICFDSAPIKDYPKSMVILLPDSFSLDFVKIDEHVAQAYILRKKAEYAKLDEDVRVKRYERDAYLRLRVSFTQYNGNLRGEGSNVMSILHGKIDGYDIFEDGTQKRLMLSVDFNQGEKLGQMSMPSYDQPPQVVSEPPVQQAAAPEPQSVEPQAPVAVTVTQDIIVPTSQQDIHAVSHSFTQ
jgi:hypothetical protein